MTPTPAASSPLSLLRSHLGWAVGAAYLAAATVSAPGLWLRRPHTIGDGGVIEVALRTPHLLLSLVLFTAGLQVPVHQLRALLVRPVPLLTGLILHLVAPLLIIPGVAFALHRTPDSDGGSGLVAAMILIAAMPVAAGATVWTSRGEGDQPTTVGLVLASTIVGPLTIPVTMTALCPLLRGGYAEALTHAARTAGHDFALTGVLLPCAAGILSRLVLPGRPLRLVLGLAPPASLFGSLLLTYINASGVLGPFLARPEPVLMAAALAVAALVCGLSFGLGRITARMLRLDTPTGASVTLACGMNNSSASAVLITTALPDRPHVLLPVLAYSLLQKVAAGRVVRAGAGKRARA
ncbi:sodium-dependent transporter [Streptomyces fagopyri]|uniref:Sodium-dependent transporter n=1 Tax=Streptomyces fagopyri TaxID=2662397 RepID=A0A5Q0LPB3_9ACTN|nr:bile acid:sodium symporter [Streptomyces fagopyri]QFZ78224.1 sodium-dependent transporter [Streptomyces fagopyri]